MSYFDGKLANKIKRFIYQKNVRGNQFVEFCQSVNIYDAYFYKFPTKKNFIRLLLWLASYDESENLSDNIAFLLEPAELKKASMNNWDKDDFYYRGKIFAEGLLNASSSEEESEEGSEEGSEEEKSDSENGMSEGEANIFTENSEDDEDEEYEEYEEEYEDEHFLNANLNAKKTGKSNKKVPKENMKKVFNKKHPIFKDEFRLQHELQDAPDIKCTKRVHKSKKINTLEAKRSPTYKVPKIIEYTPINPEQFQMILGKESTLENAAQKKIHAVICDFLIVLDDLASCQNALRQFPDSNLLKTIINQNSKPSNDYSFQDITLQSLRFCILKKIQETTKDKNINKFHVEAAIESLKINKILKKVLKP